MPVVGLRDRGKEGMADTVGRGSLGRLGPGLQGRLPLLGLVVPGVIGRGRFVCGIVSGIVQIPLGGIYVEGFWFS